MKKLLLTIVSVLLVACMVVPTFAVATPAAETGTPVAEFWAGKIDEGTHTLDGTISDGEYDAVIGPFSPKDSTFQSGSPNTAWGGNDDTQSVTLYVDYDANNLYLAAKVVDGERTVTITEGGNGKFRAWFTVATTNPYESSAKSGVLYAEVTKTLDGTGEKLLLADGKDTANMDIDNSANTRYVETTNADGTVNEVFEMKISREQFAQVTGYELGDAVYLRFGIDADNAEEKIQTRYWLGPKGVTFPEFSYNANLAAPDIKAFWKVNLEEYIPAVEFWAGKADETAPVLDGAIGADEYDVVVDVSPNGPFAFSITENDAKSGIFYVDYDATNIYLAAKIVDGKRNESITSTGYCRAWFCLSNGQQMVGGWADAKPGTAYMNFQKTKNEDTFKTVIAMSSNHTSSGIDLTSNTRYVETTNADGTVNEVFEIVIPKSTLIGVIGFDNLETLYIAGGLAYDKADESTAGWARFGQNIKTWPEFTMHERWHDTTTFGNTFKIHLGEYSELPKVSMYAGSVDKGYHAVDGIISDGEYDVKFENYTPTDPRSMGRNPWFPLAGKCDGVSNNGYFDYDENYFYIGGMTVDGARDPSVTVGRSRLMGTICLATWESADKPGSFGFDFSRTTDAYTYARVATNSSAANKNDAANLAASEDVSKYVVYRETVNADGTVNEVFEAAIPRSIVEKYAGVSVGDVVYVRYSFEQDNEMESQGERYTAGQTTDTTIDVTKFWPNNNSHGFPYSVALFADPNAEEQDPEYGGEWNFYVGGATAKAVNVDGKVDANDNYLVKLEGISTDPTSVGFMHLVPQSNIDRYTKNFGEGSDNVLNIYIGKDDNYLYIAEVVENDDASANLFDFYLTAPNSANLLFARLWGANSQYKWMSKTSADEAPGEPRFAEGNISYALADGTYTQEVRIPLSELRSLLGLSETDTLDVLQFNVRIRMDGSSGALNYNVVAPLGTPAMPNNNSATDGEGLFTVNFAKACNEGTAHNFALTAMTQSTHAQMCTKCGNVATVVEHSYSDTWISNGAENHKNVCACGYTIYEDHTPDGYVFTDVPGKERGTCTGCGDTFDRDYVSEGYLLKNFGQKWFFTGTKPSEEVGPAEIVMDGVVSPGEYNAKATSPTNTGSSYLVDHATLNMASDGEYMYFAIESYEKAVNNTHHRTMAWLYLVPVVEGANTKAGTGEFRISMNNYEDSKYGVVNINGYAGKHAMVKDFTIGYTELGDGTIEYGKTTFEFKISIAEYLAYVKTYVDPDATTLDKVYVRANVAHNRASDGLKYDTSDAIIPAISGVATNTHNANLHVLFLGDMSDHEAALSANETHGNFYTPCDTCNFGTLVPHNAEYGKKYCADCGNVEYVAHSFTSAVDNLDGTHTATCTACGYDKVEVHDAADFTAIPDTDTHAAVCSVCGGADVVEHKWTNGVVIVPAKHMEEGVVEFTCIFCNEVKQEVLPKTAEHNFRGWKEVDGKHVGTCECGETTTEEHVWNGGAITAQPTYEAEGTRTYTCTVCRATKEEKIAKLEAVVVTPPADEPADEPADDKTDDTADDDKGCGASVTAMGIALVATLGFGVAFVAKKKED